jgi:hypothetical protein
LCGGHVHGLPAMHENQARRDQAAHVPSAVARGCTLANSFERPRSGASEGPLDERLPGLPRNRCGYADAGQMSWVKLCKRQEDRDG